MEKTVKQFSKMYRNILRKKGVPEPEQKTAAYICRLEKMYSSEKYREYDQYTSMSADKVFAVAGMCLELKKLELSDPEIIELVDAGFESRRAPLRVILKGIDALPGCFRIVKKWNIDDHEKRTTEDCLTYDRFDVSDDKIEYTITKCRYIDIFEYYGIRPLCKIFCLTNEFAYKQLTRHVEFIRHCDLSDGDCCHDEIIEKS